MLAVLSDLLELAGVTSRLSVGLVLAVCLSRFDCLRLVVLSFMLWFAVGCVRFRFQVF